MPYRTNRKTRGKFVVSDESVAETVRERFLGNTRRVGDFGPEYALVQNYSEVQDILSEFSHIGQKESEEYSHLLILAGDGDYKEIWGIASFPYLDATATLLYREGGTPTLRGSRDSSERACAGCSAMGTIEPLVAGPRGRNIASRCTKCLRLYD